MRELKFRVWNKTDNQYVKQQFIGPEMYVDINGIFDLEPDGYSSYVLEHYTGLNDRNGNEIFDGDIVKYNLGDPSVTWTDLVAWESYGWRTIHFDGTESGSNPLCPLPSMEIVGNIHENKELWNKITA